MDIKKISDIVNSNLPDNFKSAKIYEVLAEDEHAVPIIMRILNQERSKQKELVSDLNVELSRMSAYANQKKRKLTGSDGFSKEFVFGEMWKMYDKWAGRISHTFNIKPDKQSQQ